MAKTTFSVKMDSPISKKVRKFCDRHSLQVGKFTEVALEEMMEDYHFGAKAHIVLTEHNGEMLSHEDFEKKFRLP